MKDKLNNILKIAICALALINLLFLAIIYFFPSKPIELIDFNNSSKNVINSWAIKNNVSVTYESAYSDTVEKGKVISTTIKNGKIFKGQSIVLVYSLGVDPETEVELIDFTDKTKIEIEEWCTENKLLDYSFDYIYSDSVEENKFISINVDAIKVKRSELIIFTISLGKLPDDLKKVVVPDFNDYSADEAKNWAKVNNVVVKITYASSKTVDADKLISQDVKVNSKIDLGSTINLVYSAGAPIKAKDLTNLEKADVNKWVKDNNNRFSVTYIEQYSNTIAKGKVISSSLKDEYVKENSNIKVYISLGKPSIDDYVSKDLALLKEEIAKLNEKGANIQLKTTSEINDDVLKNIIITQDKSGTISVNETINVKYSLGKGVYVDNYVGQNIDDVTNDNLVFKKVASDSYDNTKENGIIVKQDIVNQKVVIGSTITLTYNKGYYLKAFNSIYTTVSDAETLKTKIENDLKNEGFTNYKVLIENCIGEEPSSGTVYKQTQPGIYSKNVEIVIYIQP